MRTCFGIQHRVLAQKCVRIQQALCYRNRLEPCRQPCFSRLQLCQDCVGCGAWVHGHARVAARHRGCWSFATESRVQQPCYGNARWDKEVGKPDCRSNVSQSRWRWYVTHQSWLPRYIAAVPSDKPSGGYRHRQSRDRLWLGLLFVIPRHGLKGKAG